MYNRERQIFVTVEIDQSSYIVGDDGNEDPDYHGIRQDELEDPEKLARLLDKGMYTVRIEVQ